MTRRKATAAASDQGLRTLLDAETPVITLVGKASAFQVTEVLRTSLEENLDMIAESVRLLVEHGREVIFDAEHFFDGWKQNPDYAPQAIRAAAQAGAAAGRALRHQRRQHAGEDRRGDQGRRRRRLPVPVGIHCHNDCDLAVANSLAAVDAGAVAGAGHDQRLRRTLRQRRPDLRHRQSRLQEDGLRRAPARRREHLTELSRYVYETANMNFRSHPAVRGQERVRPQGRDARQRHRAVAASYEHIDPALVGNRAPRAGQRAVGPVEHRRPGRPAQHPADSKLMDKILAHVVSMENAGYQFEAADGSFDLWCGSVRGRFSPTSSGSATT